MYSCKFKLSVTVGKDNKFVIGDKKRKRHFNWTVQRSGWKYDAVKRKFRLGFDRNKGLKVICFISFASEEEGFVDSEDMEDLCVSNVTCKTWIIWYRYSLSGQIPPCQDNQWRLRMNGAMSRSHHMPSAYTVTTSFSSFSAPVLRFRWEMAQDFSKSAYLRDHG
jgi:hypothetical protein